MRKLKIFFTSLLMLALIIPGKAQAALPYTYQMGLSRAEQQKLTDYPVPHNNGIQFAVDYRNVTIQGRATPEEKPKAQFEIIVNGQSKGKSNKGIDLDDPPIIVNANVSDTVTIKDVSAPYAGNTLYSWDLQYKIVPETDKEISDISEYRSQFPIKAMLDSDEGKRLSLSKDGINTWFQQAWQEMKKDYPGQNCYIELYLEVSDKKGSSIGWKAVRDCYVSRPT